jgi:lipoate synthase
MIFVKNDNTDPFFNHALEEYILSSFTDEAFILWRNKPSILIGRNQNTYSEINTEFVKENDIDVVRRLSGGGTVFCDLGNINFTFITNKGSNREGFKTFATPVIEALQSLGVNAVFTGRNDITIDGKKFSGNAQYHHQKRLLHHGTLLFNGDLAKLKGALISKPLKFKDKSVKSVASRVTNIHDHLLEKMDVLEFKDYLQTFIMSKYNIIEEFSPSDFDLELINKIKKERFTAWEWNYGNSPSYTYSNHVKYPSGLVEYHLTVANGIIKEVHVYGDYFGEKTIDGIESKLIGVAHQADAIKTLLCNISINDYINGLTNEEFVSGLTTSNPSQQESHVDVQEPEVDTPNKNIRPKIGKSGYIRKPEWLRVKVQGGSKLNHVNKLIKDLNLNTVCLEANCPNKMECYNRKTATFMILGRNCTRNCTFCNVTKETPDTVSEEEPRNIAIAIKDLGLKHAVITSVTRDDLVDEGAHQFSKVVYEIKSLTPHVKVELLIPDMNGKKELLDIVLKSNLDVFNHNIETVPSLYLKIRPMASYERSLGVLSYAKESKPDLITKSGMMLGLGETENEVIAVMKDLRSSNCDILTLGQYLQPSKDHVALVEYITPEQFDKYKEIALNLGFKSVASAPLVRSSYHADELI